MKRKVFSTLVGSGTTTRMPMCATRKKSSAMKPEPGGRSQMR